MASSTQIPPLKPIELIVYSDFNCPWCYVAHKEISSAVARARAAHAHVPFKLEYRPFQLDPSLPEDKPMCRIACYKKKFGSEARMGSVCQLLQERGKSVGINFHFKGVVRQTTNAHRLVLKSYLMGGEQLQHKMLDQLFAAYFEEERDIGCFDSLSNAAVKAGVFPTHTEAKAWLSTKQFAEEVRMLVEDAGIKGIKGVPCTVINNTWVIQGAQIADTFFAALDKLANQWTNVAAQVNTVSSNASSPSSDTTAVPPPSKAQASIMCTPTSNNAPAIAV